MRALRIDLEHPTLAERPDPAPVDGDAIVRVSAALVAATDPPRWDAAVIPGHRFIGEVQSAPDASLVGTRVVAEPGVADPESELSKRGLASLDPERRVLGIRGLDGGLADLVRVPTRNLVAVPDTIDDEHALFAAALGAVVHMERVERVDTKSYVTVIGDGLHALLAAQTMSAANASVRLLTANAHRLELCTRWGVKHRHMDQAGRRADQDVVIDTGTEPGSLHAAVRMVRPRGAIVLLGSADRHEVLDGEALGIVARREIRVLGSTDASVRDGLGALSRGTLNMSGLVTTRCTLDALPGSLGVLRDPEQVALMVTMF